FGGIRWSEWSEFLINPETFAEATGATLVSLDDTITYRIGLAHRLNENWAVQGSFAYEKPQDRLVSPLAPSTGLQQIGLGAVYTYEKMEVAAGARYSWLGKGYAETGTPDVARATFGDSTALSVGLRVGFYF
ncbi:MAG: transporter, partial [Mangrovicoccus sp.]